MVSRMRNQSHRYPKLSETNTRTEVMHLPKTEPGTRGRENMSS